MSERKLRVSQQIDAICGVNLCLGRSAWSRAPLEAFLAYVTLSHLPKTGEDAHLRSITLGS